MTEILLVFSLLLHALSLLAFILLFLRQNRFLKAEQQIEQAAAETEKMMAAFLFEIKEENEALIRQLNKPPAVVKPAYDRKEAAPESTSPLKADYPEKTMPPIISKKAAADKYNQQKSSSTTEQADGMDLSRAVSLYESGLSVEEVAEKLGAGRTEIELALKFHKMRQK